MVIDNGPVLILPGTNRVARVPKHQHADNLPQSQVVPGTLGQCSCGTWMLAKKPNWHSRSLTIARWTPVRWYHFDANDRIQSWNIQDLHDFYVKSSARSRTKIAV